MCTTTRCLAFLAAIAASASAYGVVQVVPTVSDVVAVQDDDTREVTVSYTLSGGRAIILFDVLTNGVSIGAESITGGVGPKPLPQGDVFAIVEPGECSFTWQPDRTFRDEIAIAAPDVTYSVKAFALDDPPDYLVIDLCTNAMQRLSFYPSVEWLPGGILSNYAYRTTSLVMRRIHAANVTWNMGTFAAGASGSNPIDGIPKPAEERMHAVTLPEDYYLSVFEMTQCQYTMCNGISMAAWFATWDGPMRPRERVSYLSIREGSAAAPHVPNSDYMYPNDPSPESVLGRLRTMTGMKFDLPSEAQWEYAARAGHGDGYWPDGTQQNLTELMDVVTNTTAHTCERIYKWDEGFSARFRMTLQDRVPVSNTEGGLTNGTSIVGSYAPNSWGLYDMLGNVAEFCNDWVADNITQLNGAVNADGATYTDGTSVKTIASDKLASSGRVARGGYWASYATFLRPGYRHKSPANPNYQGFGAGTAATQNYSNHSLYGLRLFAPIDMTEAEQ